MSTFADTYRHKGLRNKLVQTLRRKGIKDEQVLEAIGKVPRHLFLDNAFCVESYKDKPFPIGSGQTISQPYTVAFQTGLLEIERGHKVLEIGTGSGYQACILIELGARVFTVERHKALFQKAKVQLPALGYFPKFFHGDGYQGLPAYVPFDRILVTAGAPYVPPELVNQLKTGGILVIPVGTGDTQIMRRIVKVSESDIQTTDHGQFAFVPMLDDREWD